MGSAYAPLLIFGYNGTSFILELNGLLISLTRSKVEDVMHPMMDLFDEPDVIESYYAILDYTIENLEYPMCNLKKELPELYEHFCTVFQALKEVR